MRAGWLHTYLRQVEAKAIKAALERQRWNVCSTARQLGVSRTGLSRRMRALGIVRQARVRRVHPLYWSCPLCGAKAGDPCRNPKTLRGRSPHRERTEPTQGKAEVTRPIRKPGRVRVEPH